MNTALPLDKLDDLPALMHRVQNAPASPRRFRGLVNNSLSMEETLQDNNIRERKPTSYLKHSSRIIHQHSKRLGNDTPKKVKTKRNVGEIASLANEALIKIANSNDPRSLFRNFDESRNGYVTYEDFNQALLATNAGLTKNEIFLLARTLDKDQNGILDYTELTSSLKNVSKQNSSPSNQPSSSTKSSSLNIETSTESKETQEQQLSQSEPSFTDPVTEGYQRAYDYGLKYIKKYKEDQELFEKNERKYHESLGPDIEIPYSERIFHLSSLQPSRTEPNNSIKSYHRGSGNIPVTMTDHLNGVILPSSKKSAHTSNGKSRSSFSSTSTHTHGTYTATATATGGGGGDDDESDSTSYSDIYLNSRRNRPENQSSGIAKSYNGRHITGAGHLSTTVIVGPKGADSGGPVRSYERTYIGNPTNPTNRSSRDFTNAFIVDQAKPIRHKKRPSSAPPTSRPLERNNLYNYLQHSCDTNNDQTSLPPLPAEEERNQSSSPPESHNPHAHFDLTYEQTQSTGVNTALKAIIPTYQSYLDTNREKKKRVPTFSSSYSSSTSNSNTTTSPTATIQMSLNTLLSQMNSYSKMKIFEHKMKQYDLSHSGYINKSEFVSSLARSGIHLTPDQAHVIFESHAEQPKYQTNTSIRLSDHDTRAIPISEFVNKLQTRISTPGLQKKFLKEYSSNVGVGSTSAPSAKTTTSNTAVNHTIETPLAKSDQMNWKKLITTLNSKNLDTKRSMELFKELQVNHHNQIPPNAFLRELQCLGVPLNEIEYHNLISNIKKTSNGNLDMSDFTKQLYLQHQQMKKEEEMIALMPSLQHTQQTLSTHSQVMKILEKQTKNNEINSKIKRYSQQKKHFLDQQGKETLYEGREEGVGGGGSQRSHKRKEYLELFQQTPTGSTSARGGTSSDKLINEIPSCLLNGNGQDTKKERLRWFKMKDVFVKKRDDLLRSFGGPNGLQESYTPSQIRDKFSQVGIQLGDDDFKLFHSFVQNNNNNSNSNTSSPTKSDNINFNQICDSIGVTIHTDTTRRPRAVCREDCQRDGGIFGSSEKSLLSHPTYRVNMLSSSTEDTSLGRGNRKRHYNPITGMPLDPCATTQSTISTSEFWEFKHIPELKALPGNIRSRGDPSESYSGHKNQGSSLRQLQARQRSSSAPPTTSQHSPISVTARSYLWQNQHQNEKKLVGDGVSSSVGGGSGGGGGHGGGMRFASTPLAQYLKLKHNRNVGGGTQHHDFLPYPRDDQQATPMRTSELNSSIASSISFQNDNFYRSRGSILTESHDLKGNEITEIEARD